jgi:hypothetical protein
MGWPQNTDYINALQRRAGAFRDARLRASAVPPEATDRLGRPRPISGAWAMVFKLQVDGVNTAVRVFRSPGHAQQGQRHYRTLEEHLRTGRPASLVPFRYHPDEIEVNGALYPILTMEWVQGRTLWDWAGEQARAGAQSALRLMADRWLALVEELKQFQIAHGDLQHGNVLVVGGTLKLVDYDGMCVPALVGEEPLEAGLAGYQHPGRRGRPLSLRLDDYSAWVILIALRALAASPGLWRQYVDEAANDNLLFLPEDVEDPDRPGNLWDELRRSPDAEVVAWARALRESLDRPFDAIPPFEMDPLRPLRVACAACPRDWREISRLAAGAPGTNPLPPDLASVSAEARQLCALEASLTGADPRGVAAALAAGGAPDWPEGQDLVERAREAAERVADLDRLLGEMRATRDGRRLVKLWDEIGPGLADVTEAGPIARVVASWRRRLEACAALAAAIAAEPQSESAIARAWDALRAAGGHPDALPWQPRALVARQRAPALAEARRLAAQAADEDGDRRLCQVWDEGGLGRCPEAEPLRPRVEEGRPRVVLLDDLRRLVERGGTEEQIAACAAPLDDAYSYRLRPRVESARQRAAAFAALRSAVERGEHDGVVETLWARLEEAGGHPDAMFWQSQADAARRRAAALRRLEALAALPRDEASDRAFVRAWEGGDLDGRAESLPYRPRYVAAAECLRALDDLAELFERGAPPEPILAAAEPIPPDYPHAFQDRVRRARELLDVQRALRHARAAVPRSDRALTRAWLDYARVCPSPLDAVVLDECLLAAQRSSCLDALDAIDATLPLDEQDRLWLLAWNDDLLAGCGDAHPYRLRNREVRARVAAWEALQQAIEDDDAVTVARLHADPRLAGYPPLERRRPEIAPLVERGEQARRLQVALEAGDGEAVVSQLDLPALSTLSDLFRPHRKRIIALVAGELARAPLSPAEPPYRLDAAAGQLTVRWLGWDWPLFGQDDRCCRVAVDPRQFLTTPDEAAEGTWGPRQRTCRNGYTVPLPARARQVYVTVWAVVPVDVLTFGIKEVVGPPLHLGPIALGGEDNGAPAKGPGLLTRLMRKLSS